MLVRPIPQAFPGRAHQQGFARLSVSESQVCLEETNPNIPASKSAKQVASRKATRNAAYRRENRSGALGRRSTNPAAVAKRAVRVAEKRRTKVPQKRVAARAEKRRG